VGGAMSFVASTPNLARYTLESNTQNRYRNQHPKDSHFKAELHFSFGGWISNGSSFSSYQFIQSRALKNLPIARSSKPEANSQLNHNVFTYLFQSPCFKKTLN